MKTALICVACILFPPLLLVVVPYYLIRGSAASRRTAAANERIADVIAPKPRPGALYYLAQMIFWGFALYVVVMLSR